MRSGFPSDVACDLHFVSILKEARVRPLARRGKGVASGRYAALRKEGDKA